MSSVALMTDPTYSYSSGPIETGFNITPVAGDANAFRLEMKGFLAPGWTGRLTAGLAKHRISVISGHAEKITAAAWASSFEVKTAPFSRDALNIDYIALADTEPERSAGRIELLNFSMEACKDGSLFIEVRGVDRLGFLGDLLDYFSMRCLFPVKMTIDTVGGTAVDRFWLRGVGGSRPSDSITDAVKDNLNKLLIHKG